MSKRLTAVIYLEGNGFVALCRELNIASQGDSIEAAQDSLPEALEFFYEHAYPETAHERLGKQVIVT